MSQTDAMLFENWVRQRDANAFKILTTRYAAMVYQTCKRILNDPSEAEDAAQECFLLLAATRKPIGEYLAPWLHRVAYYHSLTRLRADKRRRERESNFASECDTLIEMEWNDIQGCVDEAIAGLPDKLRVPVVAYFLDGQTHEAIAKTLEIPRSTVTYRIDRGVECLRKTLKHKGLAITCVALAGMIKSNVVVAAPSSLLTNLGKLALSGAGRAITPTTAPVWSFLTGKTVFAGAASLAIALFAGWQAMEGVDGKSTHDDSNASPSQTVINPAQDITLASALDNEQNKGVSVEQVPTNLNAASKNRPPIRLAASAVDKCAKIAESTLATLSDASDTISNNWYSLVRIINGENKHHMKCQESLKQFGLVFKVFSDYTFTDTKFIHAPRVETNSERYWPMLDSRPGHLMFANTGPGLDPVYPNFLDDTRMLICPNDTSKAPLLSKPGGVELLEKSSYYYLGYAILTNEQLEAFADIYRERTAKELLFDVDLDTPKGKLYRLREGIEQLLAADPGNTVAVDRIQSLIPVFFEAPHHVYPEGGNVLYMDGHVEYKRMTSDDDSFPMNTRAMEILNSLAQRP